ncbi:hypothetical protein QBC35DRAFT_482764 [Podospora australis]|uniref:Factor arrest protein 11 n=1 Tax=Podospora australis TaxID=1536484 RepID=A0AAN7APR5_9PEZI|nr:hypothetical protein QBC35DRAFT_482764 [Podospora australis]
MNSLWPSRASSENKPPPPPPPETPSSSENTQAAAEDKTSSDGTPDPQPSPGSAAKRPLLVRNALSPATGQVPPAAPTAPAPPIPIAIPDTKAEQQPTTGQPPNPQGQGQQQPQDSLSLAQLKKIVAEFPRSEPIAYDYVYTDMGPVEEEIDEWFGYNFWQWVRLNAANRAFHTAWNKEFDNKPWEDVDASQKGKLMGTLLGAMQDEDRMVRGEAVGAVAYLVLGRWTETVTVKKVGMLNGVVEGKVSSAATKVQLEAMKEGVQLLARCGGVEVVWRALKGAFEPFWADEPPPNLQMQAEELIQLMTILYSVIQQTLEDPEGMDDVRSKLIALKPGLVPYLTSVMAKLRWDEVCILPQPQIILLYWKSILLVFGGSKEIEETKLATAETKGGTKDKSLISASPLDYHVFRQEITSKYPAYIPPQPVIPLEAEQTTLLPHSTHPGRMNGQTGILPAPPGQASGASILNQPVHIATPAPSPPPSPGVGGKGGKKQNYQTNQNFPFMYPPLDATSNGAGGKGGAGLQDLLVGRKWEGSDVPASILEAGELFSKRVRMSRATRQLWDEREKFLKEDRGWEGADEDLIDELDLDGLTLEEKEELGLVKKPDKKSRDVEMDYGPRGVDARMKQRLDSVEEFYREALPHLQSVVIVLLKQVVAIASNWIAAAAVAGMAAGNMNNPATGRPNLPGQNNNSGGKGMDAASPTDADVDEMRTREIAAKAATGILILLLKWLKLSHVLKFEYLTQLLLDSNYIPLVLKLFAIHDVQQVVENKMDRLEHSFFYFCGSRAGVIPHPGMPNPTATEFDVDGSDEEDEAVPPPIKRRRSPTTTAEQLENNAAEGGAAGPPARPEVDELGYPVNPLPKEPITEFSRRNFFSLINYLRVLQKVCKGKAHRNLLLVHYKSSNILRKTLKVPQQELRLYTLKLFKNQVPYCGRKWRQSNMRVITAVYLYCRPELRDEWLAGSDIDTEVDQALPLEQALRSLTHWFNVRRYPEQMVGAEIREALKEEQDFFTRELEKADLDWLQMAGEGDDASVMSMQWEQEGAWG